MEVVMAPVVGYQVGDGSSVLVAPTVLRRCSRVSDCVLEAGQRPDWALARVREAAQATLDMLTKL